MNNPVLRGFHPDPSIVRVGDDYYLATSTFEWFPGVMIYHSKDLVNWELVARPLDRISLLDIKGVPDSCGVWAPCLSHDGACFHLVYSQVKSFDGTWKDTPNYLTTSSEITGPWTDPVFLCSNGFDGSLFHDENGSKWYLSMEVDHRGGKFFGDIILQEYDALAKRLTGPLYRIFEGSVLGKTEGPHLYQKDGYYYLITAEGGTEYGHASTICRAKDIKGPYELSPYVPLISTAHHPHHPLQKTGHGDLVQTPEGDWYIFFLTGRPLSLRGRCPLGRETAMAEVIWPQGDWPRLANGNIIPDVEIPIKGGVTQPICEEIDFAKDALPPTYHSLRVPVDESWCSRHVRPGFLRIYGRESLSSTFEQSLLARRVQSLNFTYEVSLEFAPLHFQQMAGLVCYYNTAHFFYLHIMGDETGSNRWLQLLRCDNYQIEELLFAPIAIPSNIQDIHIGVCSREAMFQFRYRWGGEAWTVFPDWYDGSILSDDYIIGGSTRYRPAFTGAFVGIACQDLTGQKLHMDVRSLSYIED